MGIERYLGIGLIGAGLLFGNGCGTPRGNDFYLDNGRAKAQEIAGSGLKHIDGDMKNASYTADEDEIARSYGLKGENQMNFLVDWLNENLMRSCSRMLYDTIMINGKEEPSYNAHVKTRGYDLGIEKGVAKAIKIGDKEFIQIRIKFSLNVNGVVNVGDYIVSDGYEKGDNYGVLDGHADKIQFFTPASYGTDSKGGFWVAVDKKVQDEDRQTLFFEKASGILESWANDGQGIDLKASGDKK